MCPTGLPAAITGCPSKISNGLLIDIQLIPTDLSHLKTDAKNVYNHKEKEISSWC